MLRLLSAALLLILAASHARAAPCEREDFETRVTGDEHCTVMRRYGDTATPRTLIVWLHGDVSTGGPANYHFPLAERTAELLAADRVLAVALVRPGYPDGSGASSGVSFAHGGRSDHYTLPNLAEVAGAVARLRAHYKVERVILVGHSGGAASSAVILGWKPGLVDGAVLIACPCEKEAWRARRNGAWPRSENPLLWADRVAAGARVRALTGTQDDNTFPILAQQYVDALKTRGLDAAFIPVAGAGHNSVTRAPEVAAAIAELVRSR